MRTALALLILAGCSGPAISATDAGPLEAPVDAGSVADAGVFGDAGAGADAGRPVQASGGLSIASWNLETFPRHADTVEAVAGIVEAQELDLVGIQEITDREAFDRLDAALPDHEAVISFSGWQRVGFLYRADRLEVSDIDLLWNDRGDWYAFPRPALTAEITVRDELGEVAFDFAFVVVHLKAMVDEESRLRRAAAIQRLSGWMRERALTEPEIVVVGDFNDELLDPPSDNVYGPLLEEPEEVSFLTLPNERAGDYSYLSFRKMIDHVLVSAGARAWYGEGATEVLRLDQQVQGYRERVSDHLPVVSRFALD